MPTSTSTHLPRSGYLHKFKFNVHKDHTDYSGRGEEPRTSTSTFTQPPSSGYLYTRARLLLLLSYTPSTTS